MKHSHRIAGFALIALLSCSTPKHSARKVSTGKNENTFEKTENSFQKVISVAPYVSNDSTLELYFSIYPGNFITNPDQNPEQAASKLPLKFQYILMTDDDEKRVLDSSTYTISTKLLTRNSLEYRRNHISCHSAEVLLYYDIYDPNEHEHYKNTLPFNLSSAYSQCYFRVRSISRDSLVITEKHFKKQDSVVIDYYKNNSKKLYVRYSQLEGRPAPPPFYHGHSKVPVANFQKSFVMDNHSVLRFTHEGNYLIQADTTKREGLWLNAFSEGYPYPSTTYDYEEALMYLTTEDEFRVMQQSDNKRKAIDDFWNKCTSSNDKGPLLADHYYRRVKESNDNFTTSKEGWKTDRGMMYIIFNRPDEIYKTTWGENWIYHAQSPFPAVEFHFTRSMQAWGYDYTLIRDESLRRLWLLGINSWRNGGTGEK